jgi:plasmid stabilization system protein ParE
VNQPYRLTSGAESDTEQILRYTLDQWGADQAARYAAQLEACLEKIATKQAAGRHFSKRFADAFVHRCSILHVSGFSILNAPDPGHETEIRQVPPRLIPSPFTRIFLATRWDLVWYFHESDGYG